MVLVVGASNQWFAQSLSALAVPQVGAIALQAKVEQLWDDLQNIREPAVLDFAWTLPAFQALHQWSKEEVFEAIARHHKTLESGPEPDPVQLRQAVDQFGHLVAASGIVIVQ